MTNGNNKTQQPLLWIARIFVGALFIFSGLIKANDPLGFGYKLQEYFEVFHMGFLNDIATGIAIILCTLEIVLGVLLLMGIYIRKTMLGLLLTILFFTFLTFVSAFFEVVTSCGCFGDAIPLTPWQSFSKDVILLALILFLFVKRDQIHPAVAQNKYRIITAGTTVIALLIGICTYNLGPVLDFLPYKIGSSIPESMLVPQGAKPDEYQIMYHLKNKKTGEEKDMNDADYLSTEIWKDTNWEIIGVPVKKLIKKGFQPKIKDLAIADVSGTDYTRELIENPYYNLIIVAYNLNTTNDAAIAKLNTIAINAAEQYNIRTVLLTSTPEREVKTFSKRMKLFPEVFYADGVPLKSMVRANPGVLLLKNGVIMNKWHYNRMPDFDELAATYFTK